MKDKPTASHTLGLELDPYQLKGAALAFRKGKPMLDRIVAVNIDQEKDFSHHVKPLDKDRDEKLFFSLAKKSLVATSLPASDVLVRKLEIPLSKERDIDAVLDFQAEPLLPYPVEKGIIDSVILEKRKGGSLLSVLAVRTDHLSQHLEQWKAVSVEPEVVGCASSALASFSQLFSPSKKEHFVLHLGMEETTCILVKQGKLLASQASPIGLLSLIEAFAADAKLSKTKSRQQIFSLNFSAVAKDSSPRLFQRVEKLEKELTRFFFALVKQIEDRDIQEIFLTGEGSTIDHLPEVLCKNGKKTLIFPETNPRFPLDPKALQTYAVPIGMGLASLPRSTDSINFRQKEFTYPFPWKRIKKAMAAYLVLCCVLAFTLFLLGNAMIANQEDGVKKEYLNLLAFMQKPFNEFESQFQKKEIDEDFPESETGFDIRSLTAQDLRARLNALEKEMQKTPNTFPLLPNTPRVSDVLAWLSTHPHIVGESRQTATGKPRIQLEGFHYKVVKRPQQNKMKERYQVKIELEFSTPIPRYAREFHDLLLASNEYVDSKEEVKWNSERGKYRASFFLQDKTRYPTTKKR
ncbi:MAG: pilus assembly protein PilM [Waddliaceae bacterium]